MILQSVDVNFGGWSQRRKEATRICSQPLLCLLGLATKAPHGQQKLRQVIRDRQMYDFMCNDVTLA